MLIGQVSCFYVETLDLFVDTLVLNVGKLVLYDDKLVSYFCFTFVLYIDKLVFMLRR